MYLHICYCDRHQLYASLGSDDQMNAGAHAGPIGQGTLKSVLALIPRLIVASDWWRTWLFHLNQPILLVRLCINSGGCVTHLQNDTQASFEEGGMFLSLYYWESALNAALSSPSAQLWGTGDVCPSRFVHQEPSLTQSSTCCVRADGYW